MCAVEAVEGGEAETSAHSAEELFDRIVHDLRNPLGIIACFAEALPTAPPDDRAELCERLYVNAQRALHVLEEMSLLANLRAGRAHANDLEPCDLGALLDRIASEVETAERRPVRFTRPVGALAPVHLPRLHLEAALRSVLRQVIHAAAPDDGLALSAAVGERDLTLAVALIKAEGEDHGDRGAVLHYVDLELAERVARLYAGRCGREQQPGTTRICVSLSATVER